MKSLREMTGNIKEGMDLKRESILEHSRKLFSVFGVRKTTVDDIAKNAKVAKGTIYNYFQSKEDVFSQVVKAESRIVLDKVKEQINAVSSAREKLKRLVVTKIKYFKEVIVFYKVEQEQAEELLPETQALREEFFREEENMISEIINYGTEHGEIEKVSYGGLLSHIILLALKELERPWVIELELEEVEKMTGRLVDVLFDGISVKK
jgi:AcrR family transcriptional regulator